MIDVKFAGAGQPYERCAICREETDYWYLPQDVAVCHICATFANADDVPTKKEWIRREQLAEKSTNVRAYKSIDEELEKLR